MTPRVAYLPGDGIGPEVLAAARTVAEAAGLDVEWVEGRVGWVEWTTHGDALPAQTVALLDDTDACLFGAITSKPAAEAERELPPHLRNGRSYRSPILRIRQEKRLSLNVRPNRFWPGVPSPLADPPIGHTITIFRENTEDLYVGAEAHPLPAPDAATLATLFPPVERFRHHHPRDVAVSLRVNTAEATRALINAAFAHAGRQRHDRVVLGEKPNVLRATGGLVVETARTVATEHPHLDLEVANVDALAADLVARPARYGTIAATNLFGDILSDIAAALTGGLGLAPSANLGADYALFEPVHGSAPDIAGSGRANPIAAVLCAGMLAEHLGQAPVRGRIENAVATVLAAGLHLTPDLGGSGTTRSIVDALVAAVETRGEAVRTSTSTA